MEQIGLGSTLTFLEMVMFLSMRVDAETMVFEVPALDPGLRLAFNFIKVPWTMSTLDTQLFHGLLQGLKLLLSEK